MIYRKHTLFEQGLNCAVILFVGIISAPFIPGELRMKLAPFVLLGCVLVLCLNFFYEQKRGRALFAYLGHPLVAGTEILSIPV